MSADDARREFFARLDALPEELGEVVERIKSHGEPRRCWGGPDDYSVGADWRRHIVVLTQAGGVWEERKEGPSQPRGPKADMSALMRRNALDVCALLDAGEALVAQIHKCRIQLAKKLIRDRRELRRARRAADREMCREQCRSTEGRYVLELRKVVTMSAAAEISAPGDLPTQQRRRKCGPLKLPQQRRPPPKWRGQN